MESTQYLRNQLLRDTDWASMAHGLEVRTPLVDAALLHALAPDAACRPDRVSKARLAASPLVALPDAVLNRPKTGFTVPVRDWLAVGSSDRPERGLRGWARDVYQTFAEA